MRIVVIGAGLLGTTTAYFLARQGHEVVVVDRAEAVAAGTSHANGGILHASNAAPWSRPGVLREALRHVGRRDAPVRLRLSALPGLSGWAWAFLRNSRRERFAAATRDNGRLAAYSLHQLARLRSEEALDYDGRQQGCLVVYRSRETLPAALQEAELLAEAGVRCEPLSADALRQREPRLAPAVTGGVWYPDDESGDAQRFTAGLAHAAEQMGVSFRLGLEVLRLLGDDRQVTGVLAQPAGPGSGQDTADAAAQLAQERITADACVLAAGSASPFLLQALGLRLPIQPVKGHSITLSLDDPAALPTIPLIDAEQRVVATALGRRLRVAGFAEFAGHDARPSAARARALLRALGRLLPELAPQELAADRLQPWAGLRPTTPDGRPVLGGCATRGLYFATGTGHLGWTFACGAGRLVADLIDGATPAIDPAPFAVARFRH